MSLGIVVKGPEGLVLAAESRITLEATIEGRVFPTNFDNATKLLSFSNPHRHVGVVTYGQALIGQRTAQGFVPEFEAGLPEERLGVGQFAERFRDFYAEQWQATVPADYEGPDMVFIVGGFSEGEPYGRVFLIRIPRHPDPVEQNANPGEFGITWGGQREFVDRILRGYDHRLLDILAQTLDLQPDQTEQARQALNSLHMPLPLGVMALQDCVDLALFFIRTTISAQRLTAGHRGCGGPIDVATITRRRGLEFVQRKQIVGEVASYAEGITRRV
jgi:hypothetical protein